jgi:hypothetical protein
MIEKRLIHPQRIRKLPGQFSWVDHRLVRDRHIESCSHPAAALYLFLLTVADSQGLSYYSDASIMTRLSMDMPTLDEARENLIATGLIAYKRPLYQVLSLDPVAPVDSWSPGRALDRPVPIGEVLKQIREALHD